MAWKDNLRKASFRDVPFEVEEDQGKFGRRTQTHEFPQRDNPYTEDLGRATRRFTITGFVVGVDYMERRDALVAALEQAGPGALVHPWIGTLQVNVEEATASHSITDGGVCRFHITFVEAGEVTFPAASASQGARALQAADKLQQVADADFAGTFRVKGVASVVSEGALKDLGGLLTTVEQGLGGVQNVLANPLQAFRDKFPLPQDLEVTALATEVRGLYQRGSAVLQVGKPALSTIGGGGVHARNNNSVLSLTKVAGELGKSVQPLSTAVADDAPKSPAVQRQDNLSALAGYLQRSTLVQAAGMASTMPMPVYEDGVQVRDAITQALDQASESAGDDVYQALQEVRAAVHADITARLAGAQRLMSYEPRENLPAVVLAYDRYEDVDREQEIVERNAVRHPGFLPASPLLILTT